AFFKLRDSGGNTAYSATAFIETLFQQGLLFYPPFQLHTTRSEGSSSSVPVTCFHLRQSPLKREWFSMTEKLGIIAGVVAFIGFSLFCAWHHTTLSETHHPSETPASATIEVPAAATALIPQSTTTAAEEPATVIPEVPATVPSSVATPPTVQEASQPTIPPVPALPPAQTSQEE